MNRVFTAEKLFFASLFIIIINLIIFTFSPTTYFLEDEIAFYDTIWRNVQGHRLGTDYHNPLGFGPFQLAALLWKVIGPQEYLLKLSNTILTIPIALLACLVAKQWRTMPPVFAAIFCLTTAFQLSSPNSFGFGTDPVHLGLSGFYNRISIACLSILFLHSFSALNDEKAKADEGSASRISISAMLLCALFLLKISAFIIGIFILISGIVSYRSKVKGVVNALVSLAASGGMILLIASFFNIAIDQMIHDYLTAGKAQGIPNFGRVYRTLLNEPIVNVTAISLIFGIYLMKLAKLRNLLSVSIVFLACIISTLLLNLANEYLTLWLFPPAMAIMVGSVRSGTETYPLRERNARISDTTGIIGIATIPTVGFLLILAGQGIGTITAILYNLAIAADIRSEYVVTAGNDTRFIVGCSEGQGGCKYAETINDGVSLIKSLGATDQIIATLSHSNPFPLLFLSPPPKGTQVWWNLGTNVPEDAELQWQDVLGDASVVMIPLEGDNYIYTTEKLLQTAQTKLDQDFEIAGETQFWKMYRLESGQ